MLKKSIKILPLFIAFTIVMAHSIVPHHHHVDEDTIEHHNNEHDDAHDLGDLFSHFQHFNSTNEIIFISHTDVLKHISSPNILKDFIVVFVIHFFKSGEQVPIIFHDYPVDNIPISHLSAFSLRGPPSFSA